MKLLKDKISDGKVIAAAGSEVEVMNAACRDGTVQVRCNGWVFAVDPMFVGENLIEKKKRR